MAHFAGQQLMAFFSLLATGHIQEDAEHHTIDDARVGALPARRDPADIVAAA